jgi:hypothetical protein
MAQVAEPTQGHKGQEPTTVRQVSYFGYSPMAQGSKWPCFTMQRLWIEIRQQVQEGARHPRQELDLFACQPKLIFVYTVPLYY